MVEPPLETVSFATVKDADLDVLSGYMRALRAEDAFAPGAADESAARTATERLVADPALGRAWVIRSAGRPAGYVILTFGYSIEFGGRTAFVDELYVAPSFRGRGAGRGALRFIAEWAAARGVRVLLLEVSPANEAARRLYASVGFRERTYDLMVQRLDPGRERE